MINLTLFDPEVGEKTVVEKEKRLGTAELEAQGST